MIVRQHNTEDKKRKEVNVKRGLSLLIGLNLMLMSYGCIFEHRDDEYRGHHEEYREHEEQRRGGHERDYDEHRDREEHRDYDDRH